MKEVSTISKRKSRSRPQNRRQQPRPVNKGYGDAGASWHKKATKGFRAMSGSPKEDIDANNYTLRQRARMLYMAAPIATSAIRTNRTNVVGIGLQLKSRIDREALGMTQEAADAWQAQAEREFALWSERKVLFLNHNIRTPAFFALVIIPAAHLQPTDNADHLTFFEVFFRKLTGFAECNASDEVGILLALTFETAVDRQSVSGNG